ncbi:MAG: tetratricopeptide repeat protein [Chloroflexi bacterium]|nr:tetratricopeptide repeat protein [Chloroflexota bacterium]
MTIRHMNTSLKNRGYYFVKMKDTTIHPIIYSLCFFLLVFSSMFFGGCQHASNLKNTAVNQSDGAGNQNDQADTSIVYDYMLQSGNYQELKNDLNKLLESNPTPLDAARAHLYLAEVNFRETGRPSGYKYEAYDRLSKKSIDHLMAASVFMDKISDDNTKTRNIRLKMAEALNNSGYINEALTEATKLSNISPSSNEGLRARILRLEILLFKGEVAEVLPELEKLERETKNLNDPALDYFFLQLAYTRFILNDYKKAIPLFNKAIAVNPGDMPSYEAKVYLASIYLERGEVKKAVGPLNDIYQNLSAKFNKKKNDNPQNVVLFGMLVTNIQRNTLPLKGNTDIIMARMKALNDLFNSKEYSRALGELKDILEALSRVSNADIARENTDNDKFRHMGMYRMMLLNNGELLLTKNKNDLAKEILTNLIRLEPESPEAARAGLILVQKGLADKGLLKKSSLLLNNNTDPGILETRLALIKTLYDKSLYDDAEAECEDIMTKSPVIEKSKKAALMLVRIKAARKELTEAKKIMFEIMDKTPDIDNQSVEMLKAMGDAYKALGDNVKAGDMYQKARSKEKNRVKKT